MFGFNDKLTLTACNARDIEGNILNYYATFPLKSAAFEVPSDMVSISIIEGTQDRIDVLKMDEFKIYIGKQASFEDLIAKFGDCRFDVRMEIDDIALRDLCYYISDDNLPHVFGSLNEGDIVVDNITEFKETILDISYEFKEIKDHTKNIKNYKKRYRR